MFFPFLVYGQSLEIKVTVSDVDEARDLVVGMDFNATDGYDPSFDQFAPPPPPSGTFDSRIKAGGEDYFRFYRPYTTDEVRYEVAWQIGQGPLSMDWSQAELPEEGLIYISYVNEGEVVEVSLRDGTEHTFDSFTSGSGQFELVVHLDGAEPVIAPPTISITSAPEPGSVLDTGQASIGWQGESEESEVTGYQVELAGPVEASFSTPETSHVFEDLTDGAYTFRVRAEDAQEQFSEWAERSFSVALPAPLPDAPVLVSPADEASGVDRQPQLSWEAAANADSYDLQLSTQSTFDELVVNLSGLEETDFTLGEALSYETTYFWRARGVNETGEGGWSGAWSFTTPDSPAVEGLMLIEVDGGIELVWNFTGDSDIDQFNIYRGASPDQLNEYGTASSDSRLFMIQNILQGASFYAITYVTTGGIESEFSNIVSYYNDTRSIVDQWDLISVPLNDSEIELNESQVFGFERIYKRESVLIPGTGYWVRSSSGESISMKNRGLEQITIQLNKGWNLIGGLAGSISVESIKDLSGILTTAPVYGYSGTDRIEVTHLEPAKGYWIYAAEEGEISLSIDNKSDNQSQMIAGVNHLNTENIDSEKIIFSRNDTEQVIWTSLSQTDQEQLYRYLLPPKVPKPILDVRTRAGYSLVDGESEELILETVSYPVGVRAEYEPGSKDNIYRIMAIDGDGNVVHINLIPGHQLVIDREYESLKLERIKRDEALLETRIEPNYPNPFNPVTNIRYQLAQSSEVYVDVYDVAGRRVARLVNRRQQPGQYTVNFDGSNLASGIYFLRLQAGDFLDIQKLTLIK